MNLSAELKAAADKLYNSDPTKFKRLSAWIGQGRKYGHLEADMAAALCLFWDYRQIDHWYPYLDKILDKVEKDRRARESDEFHERFKRELRDCGATIDLRMVVKGI